MGQVRRVWSAISCGAIWHFTFSDRFSYSGVMRFVLGLVQAGHNLADGEEMSQHEDKSRPMSGDPVISSTPLADAERDRLDRIRNEIANGTYRVSADDVAVELIRSMSVIA